MLRPSADVEYSHTFIEPSRSEVNDLFRCVVYVRQEWLRYDRMTGARRSLQTNEMDKVQRTYWQQRAQLRTPLAMKSQLATIKVF